MAMTFTYYPSGVCSKRYDIEIEDGVITDLHIEAGCDGNLKGIVSLIRGNRVQDVIERLGGIRCGGKATSCPDQIATALRLAQKHIEEGGSGHD